MTRIAVVNDDTVFLDMMSAVLNERGWHTDVYREADGVLDALREHRPDLIIIDIRMARPEAGWTLLELFTLDRDLSKIPKIVCSAAIVDLHVHESRLKRHGIGILPKPFDIEDLYEQVEIALRLRAPLE